VTTVATTRRQGRSAPRPATHRPAEVYFIGRDASVQFALRPFNFRVSRVRDVDPYSPWLWLDGYELNLVGEAAVQRSIFVLRAGLRPPAVIPQQRRRRTGTGAAGGQ
jgi:hypothetical protein